MQRAIITIVVHSKGPKFLEKGQEIWEEASESLRLGQYTADIEDIA